MSKGSANSAGEVDAVRIPVWENLDYASDAIVEASAGTGKTYAIQNIVLRLVCSQGYRAPEILVVTFTEKAAGELKNRIRKALMDSGRLTSDFDEMTICTIHSFCKRIIDEYAFESAMPMRSEICASTADLYRRAADRAVRDPVFLREYGARLEASKLPIAKFVAKALKDFGTPGELAAFVDFTLRAATDKAYAANAEIGLVFRAMIHRECDKIKAEEGVLTYDDLVTVAADVIAGKVEGATAEKARARLLESIRRRYRVALVDEFQDTDERQWEIFRTLFSSGVNCVDGRNGFLIVVGDPKQAIYSFRGADVGVYCRARDEISRASGSPPLALSETYRSTRSLVDAFNVFFGGGDAGWFAKGAGGAGICYADVGFPADNEKFAGLEREDEIAPVVLLEAATDTIRPGGTSVGRVHFGNKGSLLPAFAESAAREMLRMRSFEGGSQTHPLKFTYGDMCVLVDTNNDAAIVRDVLARHGIPYAQYKQKGVFASAECEGVIALMDFLARPAARGRRQALLISPLFGIHPSRAGDLGEDFERKFNALTERLMEFAARADWVRLFECVMNDECTALAAPDGDICAFNRTRSAVRQIFDALLKDERASRSRDSAELADILRGMREEDMTAQENGSLYERESAADRVQIMTMHASKGLQFPIVFVASGFGSVKRADAQERRRILYVAITRAEHRVYLPWSRRAWSWGCEVVDSKGQVKGVDGYGLGSRGADLAQDGFLAAAIIRYAQLHPEVMSFASGEDGGYAKSQRRRSPAAPKGRSRESAQFFDDEISALWKRRMRWESFTSLQAKLDAVEAGDDAGEPEYHARQLPPTLLPRNNISGNVFHEIMETLCGNDEAAGGVGFANACSVECEERLLGVIARAMRRNALANREDGRDSTALTLLRMVRVALSTPVSIGGETFVLADVPRCDRLAEVDFVLDDDLGAHDELGGACSVGKAVLNGKIDLVVRRGGLAYILDWKTNSLEDYTAESVAAAMDDANYHLQYRLYALAAGKWLRPRGLRLGGAAYIFVRGGERGPAAGVYSCERL